MRNLNQKKPNRAIARLGSDAFSGDKRGLFMQQDKIRTPEVESMLKTFAMLDDPDDIYALLMDLCTIREITEMSQRLEVARLLAKKVSYADIQKTTGVSTTTISRVSKCLNYGSGGYVRAVALNTAQYNEDEEA